MLYLSCGFRFDGRKRTSTEEKKHREHQPSGNNECFELRGPTNCFGDGMGGGGAAF